MVYGFTATSTNILSSYNEIGTHKKRKIASRPSRIMPGLVLKASTEGAFMTASGREFHRLYTLTVRKSLQSTVLNLSFTNLYPLFRVLLTNSSYTETGSSPLKPLRILKVSMSKLQSLLCSWVKSPRSAILL